MSLRLRFSLVSIGVTLLVAVVMITAWQFSQHAAHERFVAASITGKKVLWNKVVASYFENVSPKMKSVTRDRTLIKALRNNDLSVLRETANTTHNTLAGIGVVDRLQLFDLDGNYLVSVPDKFTGRTGKDLVHVAGSEGRVKQGVERDDDGRLVAVLAFPLFARGKIKGVAVYSKDLQAVLDDFQRSDRASVLIKDLQGETELRGSENPAAPPPLTKLADKQEGLAIVNANGRYHVVIAIPIKNLQGETLAALLSAQDHTATYTIQNRLEWGSILAVLLILFAASFGTYWYGKRAFLPLDQVIATMRGIAAGDLTTCASVSQNRRDEIGQLTQSMCDMVHHLRSLIGEILAASQQMTHGAHELLESSELASTQNRCQLSKAEEVGRAMAEMAVTIQDIAKNSESAAGTARQAEARIDVGADLVLQVARTTDALKSQADATSDAVNRLEQDSGNIAGILDVIRDIANQTSLLALNASIEAARAGEYGRGFAVVADEVRKLADRTQHSTGEINDLIESLQTCTQKVVGMMQMGRDKTGNSVDQARDAKGVLSEIRLAAGQIVDLNTQIASAIEEQSMVAAEINANVNEMESGSQLADQQTSQIATTGRQLNRLADELTDRVSYFQL